MNPSERINMFKPDSTTESMFEKVDKLLRGLEEDDYIEAQCDIQNERIARRAAGIVKMFNDQYGLTLEELEKLYNLNNLRKAFACIGIDLYALINSFITNDNLLADETLNVITNSDNRIITLNL